MSCRLQTQPGRKGAPRQVAWRRGTKDEIHRRRSWLRSNVNATKPPVAALPSRSNWFSILRRARKVLTIRARPHSSDGASQVPNDVPMGGEVTKMGQESDFSATRLKKNFPDYGRGTAIGHGRLKLGAVTSYACANPDEVESASGAAAAA
jgi:hypothetical protein